MPLAFSSIFRLVQMLGRELSLSANSHHVPTYHPPLPLLLDFLRQLPFRRISKNPAGDGIRSLDVNLAHVHNPR